MKRKTYVKTQLEGRSDFNILIGERTLGRSRHGWEGKIRMDLKETDVNTRIWIDSAQDKNCWKVLVNTALNLWIP